MPGEKGIRRPVQALAKDRVEGLFHGRHNYLAVVDRDDDALEQEKGADGGDQRGHAEANGDDAVGEANQHADEVGERGAFRMVNRISRAAGSAI